MRSGIASLGKHAGAQISAGLHKLFGPRATNGFGILMYHRIARGRPEVPKPTWNVTPQRFRAQLEGLLARGYRIVPLRSVIERARAGEDIPSKTTVLTFDDGYQNVFLNAWPVLKELGIPATVFVTTSFIDGPSPFPFDSWGSTHMTRAPGADWRPLTWAQCLEMHDSGIVEIGSHSHTHRDFRRSALDFEADLSASLSVLRQRLRRQDFTFSFPYGGTRLGYAGDELMDVARRSGALCALTTETELASPSSGPFGWGRYEVVQTDTAAMIAAKLEGWYDWMGRARDVFRLLLPPGRSPTITAVHL